jgi:murein DD-endopeptidase MepM/ murein hydrolase activator NlpD
MFFGFALLTVAAILIDAGITHRSPINVIRGNAATDTTPTTGGNSSNTVGTDVADTANTAPNSVGSYISGAVKGGAAKFFPGLSVERTDQGKDFGGSGAVYAIADGVVIRNTLWSGWPGTGGVVYKTAKYGNLYVMESFTAAVHVGQVVREGDKLGYATGGPDGIEAGYANSTGTGPRTPYNGSPDGTPTAGGQAFAKLLGLAPTGG